MSNKGNERIGEQQMALSGKPNNSDDRNNLKLSESITAISSRPLGRWQFDDVWDNHQT